MFYYHAFWTRPLGGAPASTETAAIELWDFEALTWLVSALEIRRHSALHLITDTRGREFVRNTGLDWIYNGGISTGLDAVPANIDARLFWTAGKVYAYPLAETPCLSLDTDAVLWSPLEPTGPIMALHEECRESPWYQTNQQHFSALGFEDRGWNWQLNPVNTGVVYFASPPAAHFYADTALRFMQAYSERLATGKAAAESAAGQSTQALLFAEQRLLPMCADRLGMTVSTLGHLQAETAHLARNPHCVHLWSSKLGYKFCAEARVTYLNHLIEHLRVRFPEARETLSRWKLDRPLDMDVRTQLDWRSWPDTQPGKPTFSLLGPIQGVVWIEDANVDIRRQAKEGSLVLPAETLRPEPGTSYELAVGGREFLRLRQAETK